MRQVRLLAVRRHKPVLRRAGVKAEVLPRAAPVLVVAQALVAQALVAQVAAREAFRMPAVAALAVALQALPGAPPVPKQSSTEPAGP